MVFPLIFGIIILVIVVIVALRILKSIAVGILMIVLTLLASYLIFGSYPDLKSIPYIGQFLPKLPITTGEAIAVIRDVLYHIDILGTSRDSENNLMIIVANTGKLDVSEFQVFVDNEPVKIINSPKDPLKSKESTTIQTDWNKPFAEITVRTSQTSISYKLEG